MEIRTRIRNEQIIYNTSNGFSLEENSFLANAIKQAYATAYNSRLDLQNDDDPKIKIFAKAIFGSDDFSTLRKNVEDIIFKIRSGKLQFLKQKIFEENGRTNGNILASVEKDEGSIIKVYLPFFDMKLFKDDRGGVVIHEIAHLCGFEREKEKFSLESAEALKNFCLLCDERISLEQINSEKNNPENSDSDEMTYRSNPNRDEKGRFDIGPDNGPSKNATGEKSNSDGKNADANKPKFVERGKINDSVKPNGELVKSDEPVSNLKPDEMKDPIDLDKFYKDLDFDPEGSGEKMTGFKNPIDALSVKSTRDEAFKVTNDEFKGLPNHNNYVDAFRHAYFNYRLAEKIGSSEAKKFADGHEITDVNDPSERAMDLMNNKIGRDLYDKNKTNGAEAAKKAIMYALKNGLLRTKPYNIKNN